MSPIIYTRHRCAPDEDPDVAVMGREEAEVVMWQCPECDAYWETEVTKATNGQVLRFAWVCMGRPREQAHLREVEAALADATQNNAPGTLMVTPALVRKIIQVHTNHSEHARLFNGAVGCGTCGKRIDATSEDAIRDHAIEKTATFLQDALAEGGSR